MAISEELAMMKEVHKKRKQVWGGGGVEMHKAALLLNKEITTQDNMKSELRPRCPKYRGRVKRKRGQIHCT